MSTQKVLKHAICENMSTQKKINNNHEFYRFIFIYQLQINKLLFMTRENSEC